MSRSRENSLQDQVDYYKEKNQKLTARCKQLEDVVKSLQHENSLLKGEKPNKKDSRSKEGREAVIDYSWAENFDTKLTSHPKTDTERKLIEEAFKKNFLLEDIIDEQLVEIVNCMYKQEISEGKLICKQGQRGDSVYVLVKGKLSVQQEKGESEIIINNIEDGPEIFGELAILYNCKRTATIRAETQCTVFGIDRSSFKAILVRNTIYRREKFVSLIKKTFDFESEDHFEKIADVAELRFFQEGTEIIRQGEKGTAFYIIYKGKVKVSQNSDDGSRIEINNLKEGNYFGEKSLTKTDTTTANVIADKEGTSCLTITRINFIRLMGDIPSLRKSIHHKDYLDSKPKVNLTEIKKKEKIDIDKKYRNITLQTLRRGVILGTGAFGTVELATHASCPNESFALKCLKKQDIIERKQKKEVMSERKIMMTSKSCDFIVPVYKTFKDAKFLYLLMQACLGGEVWTYLSKNKDGLGDKAVKFTTACVVEAFEFLHRRNIVYRDLKPENLVLDNQGYVKLTDFGFAKKLNKGQKTYTFCGTPEYVSPEVILSKGHDCSTDYWALGILIYELSTGEPPFQGNDPLDTYKIIIEGINSRPMPKTLSKHTRDLIFKLCCDEPTERLGCQANGVKDIRRHKWFSGFDFWSLRLRQLRIPKVFRTPPKNLTDTSNFQEFRKEDEDIEDVYDSWDEEFDCDFPNED
ncbi:DgyrCDS6342 [Dimorphilus gyrociliatus]|uniref:cGMP-dependent protein kinase n=1 Tax=Dimorphilus gyrociliatus TaxID=2664684 RepID=A0A7I8VPE5_9ANNE|nr:DgyrCDS6342 [Dimorphilus gyrociliatus]